MVDIFDRANSRVSPRKKLSMDPEVGRKTGLKLQVEKL